MEVIWTLVKAIFGPICSQVIYVSEKFHFKQSASSVDVRAVVHLTPVAVSTGSVSAPFSSSYRLEATRSLGSGRTVGIAKSYCQAVTIRLTEIGYIRVRIIALLL